MKAPATMKVAPVSDSDRANARVNAAIRRADYGESYGS